MKILLINDNHSRSGGAENYFFDLKDNLKKIPGISVHSLGFGPTTFEGEDYTVLASSTSHLRKLTGRFLFNPLLYKKLRHYLATIQPDIIHIHNVRLHTRTLLKALNGYPVVQTMHDFGFICPTSQNLHQNKEPCATGLRSACFWQHRGQYDRLSYLLLAYSFKLVRKQLKQTVTHFITPSPLLADYLQRNQFNSVTYIPPFIQQREHYTHQSIHAGSFLFAGYLGQHKGIDLLLDEFALARKENSALRLTIAGQGKEETYIRTRIRALQLEKHVHLAGWQPDLSALYAENAALIFPSTGMESFGLVVTEAMSHARPVIGINRGTTAWLVKDGETGLLFNPQRKGDLASKIVQLANKPQQARELGMNAYLKLKMMFNNEETIQQIITVYRTAIKKGALAPL